MVVIFLGDSVFPKVLLKSDTFVNGGLNDLRQFYSLKFYPAVDNFPPKLSLYISLCKGDGVSLASRSLGFRSVDQFEQFIVDIVDSWMFFKEKVYSPVVSRNDFRGMCLNLLFKRLIRLRGGGFVG